MNKPDHGVAAIQRLAFGGIANPTQRAVLRGSDATYLTARQRELDAFEEQRQLYNTALQDFQTNVYEPYKAKSAAYNTAAEKYNTDVYNPYKTQFDAYTKAVEEYNAGPRTADYAGPAAPTLASEFTMTAPTSPTAFAKEAPVLPFEVTDVETHQKAAAKRAVQDASDRAVAIDVVSDPGRFNFSSMSVSDRFMAEGGEVEDDLKGKTARSIVKDFKDYGYSREEIEQMANEVSAAGRGGDELLAYLSPESVRLLKANGGSGSINPITGLPEFKGGFLGGIVDKLSDAFSDLFGNKGQPAAPAPAPAAPVPVAPAPAPAPTGPTAAELAAQLEAANKKYADDMAAIREQQAAAQKLAIENALKADAEARAKAALPMSKVIAASSTGAVAKPTDPYTIPPSLKTVGAGPVIPALDLKRKPDTPSPSRYFDRLIEDPNKPPYMPIVNRPGDTGPAAPYNPISQPLPYQTKGVGEIGSVGPASSFFDQPASDPNNFFATTPQTSTGLAPGTAAIGPADMPLYGAKNTMSALGSNPNLSPGMLGGQQNAEYRTDRLGNRIYSPMAMPVYSFAKGGDIDLQALLAQNTETLSDDTPEEVINTDPLGTAQKMMADFSSVSQTNPNVSPVRKAIKRTKPEPAKSGSAKMAYESLVKGDLGAMGTSPPKLQDTDSAQAQMRELARIYQLKAQASQDRARGLSADTFGAPTLGQPTLTKGKLTSKRFNKGGEAKKPEGELSQEEIDAVSRPAFGNPNIARQVAKTKALQADRSNDVNTLPDPQTYAFAQGMLGEAPDQLGFSPTHPDYKKIIGRGEQGMVTGGVSMLGPAAKALKALAKANVKTVKPAASAAFNAAQDLSSGTERMAIAQRNAALPVEQGGLGLPANNTAMDRAAAMGFDTDVFHGTSRDFLTFNPDKEVFAAELPEIANLYGKYRKGDGQRIMPLKIRGKQLTISDMDEAGKNNQFGYNLAKKLNLSDDEIEKLLIPQARYPNGELIHDVEKFSTTFSDKGEREIINRLPGYGIDRLKVTDMDDMGGPQTQYMLPAGSDNVRSSFAAYDPFRRTAAVAAAMGVAAPNLLAGQEVKRAKGSPEGGEAAEPLQSPEEQPVTEESSASRALEAFISRLKEGAQGYLGLDPGISGSDSYRTGQALSNMPGVGAPAAVAGIFIGKGAKGWNAVSNALAKKAAKQGASPEEVWKTTGNFKAPDGQWRQEISDATAQMRESIFQGPANRILSHPELFANYPDIGRIMTSKDPYTTKSALFSGAAGPDALIRLGTAGGKNENAKGMLHELQHAIQFKEGFGQGGSKDMAFTDPKAFEILQRIRTNVARPRSIEDYAKEAWQSSNVTPEIAAMYQKYLDYHKKSLKSMDIEAQKTAGREYYNRLLGEAEARAVEARKSYTMDERLQVIPSQSYRTNGGRDIIPLDQLIVKRAGGSTKEGETSIKDQLIGAGETALTLGSGALSSVVGMPYGLYKGLTSGKYLEGKAPAIAEKEAQAFIERNTYVPRSTKGRENLEELNRLMEQSKLPPILPETAMLRSIPRAAVAAQGERIGMATEKALEKPVTEVLKRGGKSAEMLKALSAPPSNVVKKPGGNWLPGNVEEALRPLTYEMEGTMPPNSIGDAALDNWVDTSLTNYVKKQMGTPDDPVRKLAEEGITHLPQKTGPEATQYLDQLHNTKADVEVGIRRENAEFPNTGVGTSPQARLWEYRADEAIRPREIGETIRRNTPGGLTMRDLLTSKPGGEWAAKVPDTETVNELRRPGTTSVASIVPSLGFDHIMDVLREDVTTGRIRPEQLSKVSVADAVRRTHQYDQELAAKMNAARTAAREGLPVYKEYPKNYRWIQLNRPGSFAQESDAMGHSVRGYEPPVGHPDWVKGSGNSGRLSYGHGGWEAIKSGDAKVYSLVDEKGEPHTTIEVARGKHPIGYQFKGGSNKFPETFDYNNDFEGGVLPINSEQRKLILNRAKELYRERDTSTTPTMNTMDAFQKAANEIIGELPGEITQIKGKQNAAPKKEYLPFVQDFVKSGKWFDVGDLDNTGMVKIYPTSNMATSFKRIGKPAPTYVTQDEVTKLHEWRAGGGRLDSLPEGFARGGPVLRRHDKGGLADKNMAFIKAHS